MKKLLALLFLSSPLMAGTFTISNSSLGTLTISSGTASGGGATRSWVYVQGSSTTVSNGGCGGTTNSLTVTANDMLVMICANRQSAIGGTISDTASDSFSLVASTSDNSANSLSMYLVAHANGGTMTANYQPSGCPNTPACVLLEYTGTNTTNAFDVASGSAPATTGIRPITSLAATTSLANELMVNYVYTVSGTALTANNGTLRITNTTSNAFYSQDSVVASPSAYTSTMDESGGTYNWISLQAAFK